MRRAYGEDAIFFVILNAMHFLWQTTMKYMPV